MTCTMTSKGVDIPCPNGRLHKCKNEEGHDSFHECECGYQWLSAPELAEQRTGITDTTLGEPSESPFDPQFDWLVVIMEDGRGMKGSLYIPDTAKEAPQVGRVIAAGPGIFAMNDEGEVYCSVPMLSKVGDRVLFAKYTGAEIEWEDKTYLFVRSSEIIAKVK